MVDMFRFATIGTNFIVDRFVKAATLVDSMEFCAVYSRGTESGRAFADKYGVGKVYTDLMELARDSDIDGVYIASPNSLHCEQAILMMEHGKHVLCEKPIASNVQELDEMRKVARANGVILLEAMKSVYGPGYAAVRDNLHKIGQVRNVNFNFSQYSSRYDKFREGVVENAFNPELSNGALMDIGVYCVHVLLALFGSPDVVKSSGIFLSNGADAAGSLICEYDSFLATVIYSKVANSNIPNEICGEFGTMVIDKLSDVGSVFIKYNDGREERVVFEKLPVMVYEIEKWLGLIDGSDLDEDYNAVTCAQMVMLDDVRKQLGIVFPADRR